MFDALSISSYLYTFISIEWLWRVSIVFICIHKCKQTNRQTNKNMQTKIPSIIYNIFIAKAYALLVNLIFPINDCQWTDPCDHSPRSLWKHSKFISLKKITQINFQIRIHLLLLHRQKKILQIFYRLIKSQQKK